MNTSVNLLMNGRNHVIHPSIEIKGSGIEDWGTFRLEEDGWGNFTYSPGQKLIGFLHLCNGIVSRMPQLYQETSNQHHSCS